MKIWDEFLTSLEKDFGKETVDKWLRTLCVVNFDAGNLYLNTNDAFQALWFEEHIRKIADVRFLSHSGRRIKIHLKSPKENALSPKKIETEEKAPLFSNSHVDPNHIFSNLIITKENRFPIQMLAEFCGYDLSTSSSSKKDTLEISDNPIFIYGKPGSGKTHLLSSVFNILSSQGFLVRFFDMNQFTDSLVKSIKSSQMAEFRNFCRSCDVLLVDNIEVLSNKKATQEEFFHTFNQYHMQRKPILLSSSSPPKDLKDIEERLISRFEWGLTLPIQPLKEISFKELLHKKLEVFKLNLDEKIQELILKTFDDPKALCDALESIYLKRCIEPSSYRHFQSITYIGSLIAPIQKRQEKEKITSDIVLHHVCRLFDRSKEDILGKSQRAENVLPRKLAMYLMKNKMHLSYVKIGKIFSKDHSTVMSSVEYIHKQIQEKNKDLCSKLSLLNQEIMK